MKRILMALACFMAVLSRVFAAADFYITDLTPQEVAPGDTTTLTISLKNLALDYALYLRAELDPDDVSPVTAVGTLKRTVDRVEAAQEADYFGIVTQKTPVTVTYDIRVDEDAALGAYNVPLKLTWRDESGQTLTQTLYLGMDVTGEADLAVSGVNLTPSRVYADSDFTLTLSLANIGDDEAKTVECDLVLPREFSGESRAFLGTIGRGSTGVASYSLKALKEAENRAYDLTAVVTYKDSAGQKREELPFQVFVSKRGDIDLEIAGISTSPAKIYPGTDFTLSVQLENIGTQDAKSVMATISDSEGFVGEFSSFVGKIEADDVSSGIFDLTATSAVTTGDHPFTMKVVYTDEKGDEFTDTKTFNVYVDEKSSQSRVGVIVGVLVVVVLAAAFWRHRRTSRLEG